jgi:transcriptional regulator with XRE-family HTH domain
MSAERVSSRDKQIDKIIGETIRRLREQRGLTQTGVGEMLGVTFQQIQKYERGTNSIAAARIPGLCNALGVSLEELFEGTGIKRPRGRKQG